MSAAASCPSHNATTAGGNSIVDERENGKYFSPILGGATAAVVELKNVPGVRIVITYET